MRAVTLAFVVGVTLAAVCFGIHSERRLCEEVHLNLAEDQGRSKGRHRGHQ
jgi:hypothetical protein